MTRDDRIEILSRRLLPAQFDEVIFRLAAPRQYLSASGVPQATRSFEILTWAESYDQLPMLDEILTKLLSDGAAQLRPPSSADEPRTDGASLLSLKKKTASRESVIVPRENFHDVLHESANLFSGGHLRVKLYVGESFLRFCDPYTSSSFQKITLLTNEGLEL